MHHVIRTRRFGLLRSLSGSFALFAVAIVVMAASSPECTRTSDSLLGVSELSRSSNGCRDACVDAAITARHDERIRFAGAIQNCESAECRKDEAQLHASIMREISTDLQICFGSCHNQGEGRGGH
ncbi:MAG TPA: hypothetical protein VFP10_04495 [Candidatus Eisenbacteria bacterium]|nr:hypothetical protein [Candidatus Eisenbacteria bacterium]